MIDLPKANYIEWNVKSVIKLNERDTYAYRVVLNYQDGTNTIQQKSGFKTKKEAEAARLQTIGELSNGTYIVDTRIKIADFLEYWLEYDIRKRAGSENTYTTYSNIIQNHIVPILKKKKLSQLDKSDILRLYQNRTEYSIHIARQVKTVMNTALQYAVVHKLIAVNPAEGVNLPKTVKSKPYHIQTIDMQKTLTLEQIYVLLQASKDTPIHMQILFNVLLGLRRQEINGLKYSDVDYINRTISVERQLGKELNREPYAPNDGATKKELQLKTFSSKRVLPLPDLVFEAIVEERKQYEKNRRRRGKYFFDGDYICCSTYGKPRSKDFHWKHYKQLLQETGLPDIRWHDLRSTYCTLLLKNNFSPKAVSKLMGHARELITMDVYGDNGNIIAEEIPPELLSYMEEVLPEKKKDNTENVLDTMINVEKFLQN